MHVKREAIEQACRFPALLDPNHNFPIHQQRAIQFLRFLREGEPFCGPHPLAVDSPATQHVFILHAEKGPNENNDLCRRVHKTLPITHNNDSFLQIRRPLQHTPKPKLPHRPKLALQDQCLYPRIRQDHYPSFPIILKVNYFPLNP
jgi:hypothetical protein